MQVVIEVPGPLSADDEVLVGEFAAVLAVEPAGESREGLTALVESIDRVRNRFDGAATGVVGEWQTTLHHALSGFITAQAWLAANTAMSEGAGKAWLRCASDLRSMPLTCAASVSGRFCHEKVRLLCRTRVPKLRAVFDQQEAYLVGEVAGLTVDGSKTFLADWTQRALAELGDDGNPDPHGEDRLHVSATFGGHHAISGGLCAEDGAVVTGGLSSEIDGWHQRGELEGDTRCRSQLNAAAFMAIFRRGLQPSRQHGEVRPLVLALVDADTLAGRITADPTEAMARRCELLGAGPVPVETIRRLLCEGDIARVVHNGRSMPLDVGRRHRLATADQRHALIGVSGGMCEGPGCTVRWDQCAVHHLEGWDPDGESNIDNLVLVCTRAGGHHVLLHEGGWTARRTPTGVHWYRPDGTEITQTYTHHPRPHPPPEPEPHTDPGPAPGPSPDSG